MQAKGESGLPIASPPGAVRLEGVWWHWSSQSARPAPMLRCAVAGGAVAACCAATGATGADAGSTPPVEIGSVRWLTSFKAARAAAASSGKPIFLQFTEVPG